MIVRLMIFVLCLSAMPVFGDDPAQANKLLVEAVKLVQAADRAWTEQPWTEGVSLADFLSVVSMSGQAPFGIARTAEEEREVRKYEAVFRDALGLIEQALVLLQEIMDKHPSSDLAVKLITGQAIGDISAAALRERTTQLQGVLAMAEQSLAQGQNERAQAQAERRVPYAECYSSPTVNCLLAALQAAKEIEDAATRAMALGLTAKVQAESGNQGRAAETVAAALQATSESDDVGRRAIALARIAKVQAKSGDQGGAAETVAVALQTASESDHPGLRAIALGLIASAQAESGDQGGAAETVAVALQAASEIDNAGGRAIPLASIAFAQAESGDQGGAAETVATALQTAKEIDRAGLRAIALARIAFAQAELGDQGGAAETVAAALQTAKEIDRAGGRALALGLIAKVQAESGDREGTAEAVAAGLQAVSEIDNAGGRAIPLASIAGALASSPEQITPPTPSSTDSDGPPAESTTSATVQEPDDAPKRIVRAIANRLDQWFGSAELRLALTAPIWAEEGGEDTITIHFPGVRLAHRRGGRSYEFGDLAMAVTPQGGADYGFKATLPSMVAFTRSGRSEGQITVDRSKISGIWRSDLDMATTMDATVSGLRMINDREREPINVGSLTLSSTVDRGPEQLWDAHTTISFSDFRFTPDLPDEGLRLSRLNVTVGVQDADFDPLLTIPRMGASAGDKGEAAVFRETLEVFLQGRYGRLEADVTLHDLITIVGGNVILGVGGLNVRTVLDNREEFTDLAATIEAVESHLDKEIIDGLPPEMIPGAATIDIAVKRFPLRRLAATFVGMMDAARNGEVSEQGLEQVMMTELSVAETSLDIQKIRIVAPTFEAEAGGLFQIDPKSAFGATGRMDVRIQGLGNVMKLLAGQGEIRAIGVLLLLQGLGRPRLGEGNEGPVYAYELDLPSDGLGTVNGIPLNILIEALE